MNQAKRFKSIGSSIPKTNLFLAALDEKRDDYSEYLNFHLHILERTKFGRKSSKAITL
jgi:hypothetical protein